MACTHADVGMSAVSASLHGVYLLCCFVVQAVAAVQELQELRQREQQQREELRAARRQLRTFVQAVRQQLDDVRQQLTATDLPSLLKEVRWCALGGSARWLSGAAGKYCESGTCGLEAAVQQVCGVAGSESQHGGRCACYSILVRHASSCDDCTI